MSDIFEKIQNALAPKGATLVVVSKNQPDERVMELYAKGQRVFAENRVQELLRKYNTFPQDIEWHLIGHLQTNKVKAIAPFVHTIHSVDSLKLLQEINQQAAKVGRTIHCLLQFHIAQEATKFGLEMSEAQTLLERGDCAALHHVHLCGVMGMASLTDNNEQIRKEFRQLHAIFENLKTRYFPNDPMFKELSMGMSGDWEIALEAGSTMLRIGSLLFP